MATTKVKTELVLIREALKKAVADCRLVGETEHDVRRLVEQELNNQRR